MQNFTSELFSQQLLHWFDEHGRHHLPWQTDKSAYRVWVSEIMLQQTQVTTVIDYFHRFIARFPTVFALATATQDDVLHYWSGLGYYARARNLHRAAQQVVADFHGEFPRDVEQLVTLPGIGRSTAGAVSSLAYDQRAVILDGNVKRVLTRVFGIHEWPGKSTVDAQLWTLADSLTPTERVADYNQAMMDMGATLCTRTQPHCTRCPLKTACYAYAHDCTSNLPQKKPKKILPVKSTYLLMVQHASGDVLLEKRPDRGIWGSLWCFPEVAHPDDVQAYCETHLRCNVEQMSTWAAFRHTFSHYHLDITPILVTTLQKPRRTPYLWYNRRKQRIGLAAPTQALLTTLETTS